MLKLTGLRLPPERGLEALREICAKTLGVPERALLSAAPLRLSLDSRRKGDVHFICTAAVRAENEDAILEKGLKKVAPYEKKVWRFPFSALRAEDRPVVCGMGPAGLFAALSLAEAGAPPIILERGRPVERRQEDVERYWATGELDETSNVQFGEGGAGTFSDGKLNTGISDARIPYVLERFVEFGAPEDILYDAKPHIGTDKLRLVVKNMRERLLTLGCDIRFEHKLVALETEDGGIRAVRVSAPEGEYELPCRTLLLALGNAARDTFRMLHECGAELAAKPFAVGVRIEHRQADIDRAQYGEAATLGTLPASGYKLAVHTKDGRGVFTFCVCPGGRVVAAASQQGGVVTNGMSEKARAGENCNGGLLVSVAPEDFDGLFGGMEFQESLERKAFASGGGDGRAPAQTVGDFLRRRPTKAAGKVAPSYKPGVRFCNLWDVLPKFLCEALYAALPEMEKKIRGFASPDAVLTAVETRSSSPVRIVRDETMQSNVRGLFPCGEGGGWAGGIMSSAVDGLKCAEAAARCIKGE